MTGWLYKRDLGMTLPLFRKASWSRPPVLKAYDRIVTQARQPVFYVDFEVADTVQGRFDLILLHLVLVLRSVRVHPEGPAFAQDLFDLFVRDMDRSLREMGVGDISIAKKMKKVGQAFYGRAQRYEEALETLSVDALSEAVARNIYDRDTVSLASRRLAFYGFAAAAGLKDLEPSRLLAGEAEFPDPLEVAHG